MKQLKKFYKLCMMIAVLSLIIPVVLPVSTVVTQAATIKIDKKEITLTVGKSSKLKIIGAKENDKIKWTTSDKAIATVSSAGKVTGKKAGKATITATVANKKYTCKVTVKNPKVVNPKVANAPFSAKEVTFGKIKYVLPKEWVQETILEQGNSAIFAIYAKGGDPNVGFSNIKLVLSETGIPKPDYALTRDYFSELVTEDLIVNQYAAAGANVKLSNFQTSDYESDIGTAFKIEFDVEADGESAKQAIYDIYIDNYLIEVNITNIGDATTPDIMQIGEYLLNSIQLVK